MADYETVPYVGYPIAAAHPRRLAWTSFVHGGPRPDPERARVLEVGCGDGATSLPIAAWEPAWTVHGVDVSPRAISAASASARTAGLGNATFACADVAELSVEPGAWDFVIAHGLYSWIDPARRTALRRLIRRALSPAGLAYVSFNALPAWGVRGRIRDALLRHGGGDPRALLDRLAPHAAEDPWGRVLAHEIARARAAREDYLAHEYLAAHNDAFWVGDVIADAGTDGLRWVGDAQFDLPEGCAYEELKSRLGVAGTPGEELTDLLGYRQFRCAVFARDDAACAAPPDAAALLEVAYVSGDVRPAGGSTHPVSGEETMRCGSGLEIRVGEELSKAALAELAAIHPDGLQFAELTARARGALAARGRDATSTEERALAEGIVRVWRAGGLALRLHRPCVRVEVSTFPAVSAFTRHEAAARSLVSTPLGATLPLDAVDRAIVAQLDGTRDADAIAGELGAAMGEDAGRLSATAPAPSPRAPARERVEALVAALARGGVLTGP